MTWMLDQDGSRWQVVNQGDGRLLAVLTWDARQRLWRCDCLQDEPCRHRHMLEAMQVGPPAAPRGTLAQHVIFDPFTEKGY